MAERQNPFRRFVDLEGVLLHSETPSLKAIFDNFRNYPILALFYVLAREIAILPFTVASALHYVLLCILIFLSIATFVQTAILLTATVLGLVIEILPTRYKPESEYLQWWFALVAANFFIFCFFLGWSILLVLNKINFRA